MALTIGQIAAVSYNAVLAEARTPANQWAESAFMTELERQGGIERKSLGAQIEATLDYRRNPGTAIQASDLQPVVTSKTEVITAAVYDIAEVTVPVTWSKKDEVQTPTENAKVNFTKSLLLNAFKSHDDILEASFFLTSTNGFLGFLTHIVDAGTGSDGGIDSSVETWWRNQQATYVDDTDIEAAFTTVWNACSKGSGSELTPTLAVSDGATQAIFEGTQQPLQRYETQDFKAGAKTLMVKTARYIFSQYGTSRVLFMNPTNFKLVVSREYFRDRGETQELENANGWRFKVYSAVQSVTNNRNRLGVAHV
jgi:hypothetical protein